MGSPLRPFRHPAYATLWTATVVANVGTWMYSSAASWLMTELDTDPLMVSLVQVASSLPMFLFALPAGALADIVDRRRYLLVAETVITALAAIFAALVWLDAVTPFILLLFAFLIGAGAAAVAPAWQAIVPQLVPPEDLTPAIAANSVGVNISRAIGPALGGVLTVAAGIAAPFWINALANFGTIGALLRWHPASGRHEALPAERLASAVRTGLRYAHNNPPLKATLLRAIGFFVCASAYWALLPLVARTQIAGGAELYGRTPRRDRFGRDRGCILASEAAQEAWSRQARRGGRLGHRDDTIAVRVGARGRDGDRRQSDRGRARGSRCYRPSTCRYRWRYRNGSAPAAWPSS